MQQTEAATTTASALEVINNLVSNAADLLDQLPPVSDADAGAMVDLFADVKYRLEADLRKALVKLADGRDLDGEYTAARFHDDGRLYVWPRPEPMSR